LVDGISQNQEMLFDTIFGVIAYLAESFITMLPQIVQLGMDLIVSLANGISDSLPTLMPTIVSVILEIVNTLTNPKNLSSLLNAAMQIILSLAQNLLRPEVLDQLITAAVSVISTIASFLMENLDQLLGAAIEIIVALVGYLLDPDNISRLVSMAAEIIVTIADGLVGAVGKLLSAAGELIGDLIEKFKETDWLQVGKDIIAGIKKGISEAFENLKEWFSGLFDDLIGIAKKILGIASPSKVFKRIGRFTAEGFGVGFDDEFAHVKDDMEKALTFDDASIGINASIKKISTGQDSNYGNAGGVSIVQNIYSEAKTAADLMQEALYQQERAVLLGV
jgi:hypothetical protein